MRRGRLADQPERLWKGTLSVALDASLFKKGLTATVLDGDNLRHGLCSDLGFKPEDRAENIRRAAETARLTADAGLIVITALVFPYAKEASAPARSV